MSAFSLIVSCLCIGIDHYVPWLPRRILRRFFCLSPQFSVTIAFVSKRFSTSVEFPFAHQPSPLFAFWNFVYRFLRSRSGALHDWNEFRTTLTLRCNLRWFTYFFSLQKKPPPHTFEIDLLLQHHNCRRVFAQWTGPLTFATNFRFCSDRGRLFQPSSLFCLKRFSAPRPWGALHLDLWPPFRSPFFLPYVDLRLVC